MADIMIPKLLGATSIRTKPELATRIRAIIESNDPSGIIVDSMAMADRPDSTSLLPQITCPTLVIVGDEDQPTPPAEAQLMVQAIPGATLTVIPGAVLGIFFLMPFIGYFHIGHRFNQAFTVLVLLAAVGLTGVALAEDYFVYVADWMRWTPDEEGAPRHPQWLFAATRVNPSGEQETVDTFPAKLAASHEFLAAREAAERDARRTHELIGRRERMPDGQLSDEQLIPRQGAVHLLRNDPLVRGPAAGVVDLDRIAHRERSSFVTRLTGPSMVAPSVSDQTQPVSGAVSPGSAPAARCPARSRGTPR